MEGLKFPRHVLTKYWLAHVDLGGPSRSRIWRQATCGVARVENAVLIISMAVLVTVASLFASAWPSPSRAPATQRTASSTDAAAGGMLPALELIGADGAHVPLRAQRPAVILLTDGCDCAELVTGTIDAVPARITVITVTKGTATASAAGTPPTGATPQAQGKTVRALRDPTGELRKSLNLADPDGTATAVLVSQSGQIVRTVNRVKSVETFRPDLARI